METKSEKRICQNCKKEFTIDPEDFNFYEKIKVRHRLFARLADYKEDWRGWWI